MSRTDVVDEETLRDDEYYSESINSDDLTTRLKNQALSFARQVLCFCTVIMFPILYALHDVVRFREPTEYIFLTETGEKDWPKSIKANHMASIGKITVVSLLANISSAALLYCLGRKLTIVIANLLFIVVLLHPYESPSDREHVRPYYLVLEYVFVSEFSLAPYLIYLAEITSPTFRAFFIGLYVFEGTGIKGMKLVPRELPMKRVFRYCAIVTSFSLILALFLPETPFFVMLKGNREKAEETFSWLRAGDSNTRELHQMTARAENITEYKELRQQLVSRTFLLSLIFSCFIVYCTFDPCAIIQAFLNDFNSHDDANKPILKRVGDRFRFCVVSLFLAYNFIVPRKVIFLLSYLLGILIVAIQKLEPTNLLTEIESYCHLTQVLGISELVLILPVEIYPAALREIGVAISIILNRVHSYLINFFMVYSSKTAPVMNRFTTYTTYFGSLFCALFILLFLPETQNINIYQFDELDLRMKIHLPFIRREDRPADEDEDDE